MRVHAEQEYLDESFLLLGQLCEVLHLEDHSQEREDHHVVLLLDRYLLHQQSQINLSKELRRTLEDSEEAVIAVMIEIETVTETSAIHMSLMDFLFLSLQQ